MNNAVIYARYSSQAQNEQSIEGQIRICTEYAEGKGFRVVKTYIDKAKTGTNDNRPYFQRMINDAESGAFQYVIVYKFDRFARNRFDSMMYKQQLRKQHDIRVISALEPVSDDEGGEIYEMFLEWNDEKYSQRLSKRVRDGLATAIDNGTYTGSKFVFGYKLIDTDRVGKKGIIHKVAIDAEQAEIVRYVFEEYARGVNKKEIADTLNAKGFRHRGDLFRHRTFEKWLFNPKYTGEFVLGGRLVNNIYPPIISRDLFDKVQDRLKVNKIFTKASSVKEPYLLTSKLFCGGCGTLMRADSGVSKTGATHKYYVCNKARKHDCDKKRDIKDDFEIDVAKETIVFFSDPKQVKKVADDVVAHHERISDAGALKSIDAQIAHAKKDIQDTTKAFIQAVSVQNEFLQASCQERSTELGALLNDLQNRRTKLELERGQKITQKDIISFIAEFIDGDINDKDFQKRLIDNLVYLVYSFDNRANVFFSVRGSTRELPHISKTEAVEAMKIAEPKSSATNDNGHP
jgi:DNA invertase Pin-like site-specific DNA recombinase